jgi:hypothetical protein
MASTAFSDAPDLMAAIIVAVGISISVRTLRISDEEAVKAHASLRGSG